MDELFSNHFKGEQLQAALYAWIEHNNQDLIDQALISPPAEYIDWEDLIRFAVQQNNMHAFDSLIVYSKNNLSDVLHNAHLQSAVWDSVVHNVEYIWNQYFEWAPHLTPLNAWRERLYVHTAKHNRLQMLERLQNHTQVSFDTWRDAVISCVEKGHPHIYAHLLQHPVEQTAQAVVMDLIRMVCNCNNIEQLLHVGFEYVGLDDALAVVPYYHRDAVRMHHQTYQQIKAREQKQTLMDNISSPCLTSKRKI